MSLRSDGRYRCDRCGRELENGGAHESVIAADLDPVTGGTVTYHFGREEGCAAKVLSKRNLADLLDEGTPGLITHVVPAASREEGEKR